MQTRSVLGVRTLVVVASIVVLVALGVWSIGLWLTSTQSLQNQVNDLITQNNNLQTQVTNLLVEKNGLQTQVTSLQNDIASLNDQLAEEQQEIEDLEATITIYREYIANLLGLYLKPRGGSTQTLIQ